MGKGAYGLALGNAREIVGGSIRERCNIRVGVARVFGCSDGIIEGRG